MRRRIDSPSLRSWSGGHHCSPFSPSSIICFKIPSSWAITLPVNGAVYMMVWPKPSFLKAVSSWQLPSWSGVAALVHSQLQRGWLPFVRAALPHPGISVNFPCSWLLFFPLGPGSKESKVPRQQTQLVPRWCPQYITAIRRHGNSISPVRIYCFLLDETTSSGVITSITFVISFGLFLFHWNPNAIKSPWNEL